MRIGVRCDAMIELPDAWRRLPGIHICRLSPSETIEALDICIYLFSDGRAGLSQAVTEMSSTDQTKFCVFDQNYEEDIAIFWSKQDVMGIRCTTRLISCNPSYRHCLRDRIGCHDL